MKRNLPPLNALRALEVAVRHSSFTAAADELGVPVKRLWSGAGHDARYAQEMAPSAMIFARSVNGLSHCEQEHSRPEDLEAGANVLLHAALRLAGIEGERSSRERG